MDQMPQLQISRLRVAHRKNLFEFIITDLELGSTFATIALDNSHDQEKRERNQHYARRAFEEASRFIHKTQFTAEEREMLDVEMGKLRAALNLLELGGVSRVGNNHKPE